MALGKQRYDFICREMKEENIENPLLQLPPKQMRQQIVNENRIRRWQEKKDGRK